MTKRYWHDLVDGTLVENIPLAELTTDTATNITGDTATLGGSVDTLEGNINQLDYFFEYGEVGAGFPNSTTPSSTSAAPITYTTDISGLSQKTDYEFRAAGTVDGETFIGGTQTFTTQSVIPDSAVNRWPMDEGSGSTIADAIGGADASITGDPIWVSGDYQGGVALDWDGADDLATATVNVGQYDEWMLSTTVETASNQRGEVFWWDEDGSFGLIGLAVNENSDFATWAVTDGATSNRVTSTTTVTDGSKHRVSVGVIEGSEIFIAVDGSIEDTTSFGTTGPVSDDLYFSNHNNAGRYYEGVSDHPIIYTDAGQSTIDGDYNAQPWT